MNRVRFAVFVLCGWIVGYCAFAYAAGPTEYSTCCTGDDDCGVGARCRPYELLGMEPCNSQQTDYCVKIAGSAPRR